MINCIIGSVIGTLIGLLGGFYITRYQIESDIKKYINKLNELIEKSHTFKITLKDEI